MTKWEYVITARLTEEELMHILNKHGKEGWELAALTEAHNPNIKEPQFVGILKKPIEEAE